VKLRRPPYQYEQAGWFLLACLILGGCIGALIAGLRS
jgi:hypothetical protein